MKKVFCLKKEIITFAMVLSGLAYGQVGINTENPNASLDVTAKNPTGTSTATDGILIPRVDRQRAQNMSTVQTSTLIYVNDILTGSATGKAVNINELGFYFFNGNVWEKLNQKNTDTNTNVNISTTKSSRGLFNVSTVTTDSPISFLRKDGAVVTIGFTQNNTNCTRNPVAIKITGGTGSYANSGFYFTARAGGSNPASIEGFNSGARTPVDVSSSYITLDNVGGPLPTANDTFHYFLRNRNAPYDSYIVDAGSWVNGSVCGYSLVVTQNP